MDDVADPGKRPFSHRLRVYFEDTDAMGIIYHSNYLDYFERARSEAIGLAELLRLKDEGHGFVVYEARMRFRAPAKLGDDVEIRTAVKPMSPFRLRCWQDAYLVGEREEAVEPKLLVKGVLDLAFIGPSGGPAKLAPELLARFEELLR